MLKGEQDMAGDYGDYSRKIAQRLWNLPEYR